MCLNSPSGSPNLKLRDRIQATGRLLWRRAFGGLPAWTGPLGMVFLVVLLGLPDGQCRGIGFSLKLIDFGSLERGYCVLFTRAIDLSSNQ